MESHGWIARLTTKRSQHLVFLAHVWLFTPFLVVWLTDRNAPAMFGEASYTELRGVIALTFAYLLARTWIAYREPFKHEWHYVFPPLDVVMITAMLSVSHRGPLSNLMLLFFLPIIEAAGSLNVKWSAVIGVLVVFGTAVATSFGLGAIHDVHAANLKELWQEDPVNVIFRLFFLFVVSSLMAFQALIAAAMKERLAVAADRNRIAADMHDGVQGHLISLASQLELIGKMAQHDPAQARIIAGEAREVARQGADELRFLVQRMRAPALTEGFVPALRQYADNFCARNSLALEFRVEGDPRDLSPEIEAALFRVAQEALNNVAKHARASRVLMVVGGCGDKTNLAIQDDGCGFEPVASYSGCGLESMTGRMRRLGGTLTISSEKPGGTRLLATI